MSRLINRLKWKPCLASLWCLSTSTEIIAQIWSIPSYQGHYIKFPRKLFSQWTDSVVISRRNLHLSKALQVLLISSLDLLILLTQRKCGHCKAGCGYTDVMKRQFNPHSTFIGQRQYFVQAPKYSGTTQHILTQCFIIDLCLL